MPFNISPNIILTIIGILIVIVLLLLIKSFLFSPKPNLVTPVSISPTEEVNDLGTVTQEEIQKEEILPATDVPKLSLKEKIEISWKFLQDITTQVLTRFSRLDTERIKICGNILKNYGMRYEHVVDSGRVKKPDKNRSRTGEEKGPQKSV